MVPFKVEKTKKEIWDSFLKTQKALSG
ncbi:hypothetical protein BSG1_14984 [Bacillus sp. SG-1]|nr:hypothetical protein BSG1_14984 [Bacillus sp. SG-1]